MNNKIDKVTMPIINMGNIYMFNFKIDHFYYYLSAQSSKRAKRFPDLECTNIAGLLQDEGTYLLTIDSKSTCTHFQSKTDMILPEMSLGKLLITLFKRYERFKGEANSGIVIFLTGELYGYACRLEAYLLELAHVNQLEPEFLDWIENANFFYDSYEYAVM